MEFTILENSNKKTEMKERLDLIALRKKELISSCPQLYGLIALLNQLHYYEEELNSENYYVSCEHTKNAIKRTTNCIESYKKNYALVNLFLILHNEEKQILSKLETLEQLAI